MVQQKKKNTGTEVKKIYYNVTEQLLSMTTLTQKYKTTHL